MTAIPHHDVDFGRSYLTFSTTRVNHTPRLQIDAACTFCPPQGQARTYFLTVACIGEAMYVPTGLIHEPVCEFNLIAAPCDEFVMIKRHANSDHDVRSAHRFGDVMPTHDGKGAKVIGLDVKLIRAREVEPISNYEAFRDALLSGAMINGRTTYTDEDGKTQVTLEYPTKTTNVAHDKEAWQVDAGPIAMPATNHSSSLTAERLDLAYLVFNRWDYAEAVIAQRTPLSNTPNAPATHHYSLRRNLVCRNELFVLR